MLQLIVEQAQTVKDFTDTHYAQASFCFRTLLKDKEIKVNGKKIGGNVNLHVGDCVQYYLTKKQEERTAYTIIYQDENVVVVDKESGVNAEAVFAALSREYGANCGFIHRLDRNTQGVMIFSLQPFMKELLLAAFKMRKVEKIYHALCIGCLPKQQDICTAYLQKDEEQSLVKVYDQPRNGAEEIVTAYKVLEEIDDLSVVEIILHTGKTHQIRAHMAHLGNPLLGDMKYGDEQANKRYNRTRQCLIAKQISLHLDGAGMYLNDKTFLSNKNF